MSSSTDMNYRKLVEDLKSDEEVYIKGFAPVVELIFDYALEILPVLTESQYQKSYKREFGGQTWMSSSHQGTVEEVRNAFLNNMKSHKLSLETGDFRIGYCSKSKGFINEEHFLLLMRTPNGFHTIDRIYKTENGIRAVGTL